MPMVLGRLSPLRRGAVIVFGLGALGCNLFSDIARDLCDEPVLQVTTTEDTVDDVCSPEDCSLRDAIMLSNTCPGTQTIRVPTGRYGLGRVGPGEDRARTGDLDITDGVILLGGEGTLTVDTGGPVDLGAAVILSRSMSGTHADMDRVFHIHPSATNVQISGVYAGNGRVEADRVLPRGAVVLNQGGLEFFDGYISDGDVRVAGATISGGAGLFNEGSAALRNVELAGNHTFGDIDGAAIYNTGRLVLEDVHLVDNRTGDTGMGGGLFNGEDAEATIINSVFWTNAGGDIANFGRLTLEGSAFLPLGTALYQGASSASTVVTNTTVSGQGFVNEAGTLELNSVTVSSPASWGPGLALTSSGTTRLVNSIISSETAACSGDAPISLGHNLDNDGSCGLAAVGDLSAVDPRLGSFPTAYGSPAADLVLQLNPGSPAIDAGAPSGTCPATDQRGVARPLGAGCDIGAYESSAGEFAPTLVTTPGLVPTPGSVPTAVGLATPTPLGSPTATFLQNTNCRAGPSTLYDLLRSFLQGETATVEGRNDSQPRWWWLLIPGSNAHCWVSDTTVDLDRPADDLPVIQPPPPPTVTSTPQEPAPPDKLAVTGKVCNASTYSVSLGWNDVADNEDGYRVYRGGSLIATLGANATSYTDEPPGSGPYTYGVEAFNDAGASKRPTVTDDGCLY